MPPVTGLPRRPVFPRQRVDPGGTSRDMDPVGAKIRGERCPATARQLPSQQGRSRWIHASGAALVSGDAEGVQRARSDHSRGGRQAYHLSISRPELPGFLCGLQIHWGRFSAVTEASSHRRLPQLQPRRGAGSFLLLKADAIHRLERSGRLATRRRRREPRHSLSAARQGRGRQP